MEGFEDTDVLLRYKAQQADVHRTSASDRFKSLFRKRKCRPKTPEMEGFEDTDVLLRCKAQQADVHRTSASDGFKSLFRKRKCRPKAAFSFTEMEGFELLLLPQWPFFGHKNAHIFIIFCHFRNT